MVGLAALGCAHLSFWAPHPDPLDDVTRLGLSQKIVAVLVLVIFLLVFTPVPMQIIPGEPCFEIGQAANCFGLGALVLGIALWIVRRRRDTRKQKPPLAVRASESRVLLLAARSAPRSEAGSTRKAATVKRPRELLKTLAVLAFVLLALPLSDRLPANRQPPFWCACRPLRTSIAL